MKGTKGHKIWPQVHEETHTINVDDENYSGEQLHLKFFRYFDDDDDKNEWMDWNLDLPGNEEFGTRFPSDWLSEDHVDNIKKCFTWIKKEDKKRNGRK